MGVGSSKPEDVDESKINKEDDPAENSETTEDREMPTNRSGKEIGAEDDDDSSDEEKETVRVDKNIYTRQIQLSTGCAWHARYILLPRTHNISLNPRQQRGGDSHR